MNTNDTTATDRQMIRGACPATGRSASVCADQTHVNCYAGQAESERLDRKVEAEFRAADESY